MLELTPGIQLTARQLDEEEVGTIAAALHAVATGLESVALPKLKGRKKKQTQEEIERLLTLAAVVESSPFVLVTKPDDDSEPLPISSRPGRA